VEADRSVSYEVRTSAYNKVKVSLAAGRVDLQGCVMLWITYCLDNRLTDGGKVLFQPIAPAAVLLPGNIFVLLLIIISIRG
jgi:hypothetical protein